jgi:hypothetical protein
MIQSLIKLAVLVLACVLVYNYFFGTSEEKDQSRAIFGKVREVVVMGADVLKSEKQKYDAGKYDKLMNQLGVAYKAVRDRSQYVDKDVLTRLDDLEKRKAVLQKELDSIQQDEQPAAAPAASHRGLSGNVQDAPMSASKAADQLRRKEELVRQMQQLFQDSDVLLKQAQGE